MPRGAASRLASPLALGRGLLRPAVAGKDKSPSRVGVGRAAPCLGRLGAPGFLLRRWPWLLLTWHRAVRRPSRGALLFAPVSEGPVSRMGR